MAKITSPAVTNITSMLQEERVFAPPKAFASQAHVKSMAQYRKLYNESIRQPEKFWGRAAKEELVWFKPWKKVLQWKLPYAKWFVGGRLNVSYNCLDRHLGTADGEQGGADLGGRTGRPRAFRARNALTPTNSCITRFACSPMCSNATASKKATASLFICRWCRRRPSPCWPARASARFTRWCSAVSARNRSPTAFLIARPNWWLRRTAVSGAGAWCR